MVMDGRSRKPLQRAMMGGAGFDWLIATEYCYVDEATPASNFGYPSEAKFYTDDTGGTDQWALFKFANLGSGNYTHVVVGETDPANTGGTILFPGAGSFAQGYVAEMYAVLQDFDPSAITWNDAQTLSISGRIARFVLTLIASAPNIPNAWTVAGTINQDLLFVGDVSRYIFDLDDAYGILLKPVIGAASGVRTWKGRFTRVVDKEATWAVRNHQA